MFIEHLLFSWTILGGQMDKKMNEIQQKGGGVGDPWISLLPGHTEYTAARGLVPSERNPETSWVTLTHGMWTLRKYPHWNGLERLRHTLAINPTPSIVPHNQEQTPKFQLPPEERGVWITHIAPQLLCTDYYRFHLQCFELVTIHFTCKIFLVERTYPQLFSLNTLLGSAPSLAAGVKCVIKAA